MARIKKYKPHKRIKLSQGGSKKNSLMTRRTLWTAIIALLMVGSVFGIMFYGFSSGTESLRYNGFNFQGTQTGWNLELDDSEYVFEYHPSDLEYMELSSDITERLSSANVWYITFDPDSQDIEKLEVLRFRMQTIMAEFDGKIIINAVKNQSDAYAQQPVITCENSTVSAPVIDLTITNQTVAYMDGNCVRFDFEDFAGTALMNRLVYSMIGIMD